MSDDPKCPRCGTKLPTVTVQKPIAILGKGKLSGGGKLLDGATVRGATVYADVEEMGECVRCTGSY